MSPLIIAGFHRSGTSTLARLMSRAGVFLGWDLIGSNASNPYGHYEDRAIVGLHNEMLADAGWSWHVTAPLVPFVRQERGVEMFNLVNERRTRMALWGFKDPRVCFFLSNWKHIVPDLKVCIIYRHPNAAIGSLERRQSRELFERKGPEHLHSLFWTDMDHGLKMWNAHNKSLVRFARAWPEATHVVSFEELLMGREVVLEIEKRWKLGLAPVEVDSCIDPSLGDDGNRTRMVCDSSLIDEALGLWEELVELSEVKSG